MQAANTGLTGGSTPDGRDYDREIVIISTLRITKIRLIDEGRQVICLAGATLFELERTLKPLGREPHSVIGSSCIGASVMGGMKQQLRRAAHSSRSGLYPARALRPDRRSGPGSAGQSSRRQARRRSGNDPR